MLHETLRNEIQNGCRLRPVKRMALQVALILSEERSSPADLGHALGLMEQIKARIENVRV